MLLALATALAADPNAPHPHHGLVTPYTGAPPPLSFSAADLAQLEAGKVVLKQQQVESGGRGIAVMNIHATPAAIWSKITDYADYPKMVDKVSACGNYKVVGNELYTRFVLDVMGMDVEYYVHHTWHPEANYLTWTLDYSRKSDLDDSVGYWRVTPLTTSPALSRLEYSVDIRVSGLVPGFVQDMIAKKGLTDATSWVKRESERAG
jgi:hypothetical protein